MANPTLTSTLQEAVSGQYQGGANYSSTSYLKKEDVMKATLVLLSITSLIALAVSYVGYSVSSSIAIMASVVGIGGVLAMSVGSLLSPALRRGSRAYSMIFAVFEGLMVGGFTYAIGDTMVNGVSGWILVSQAILGTIGLFFLAAVLYGTGVIQVTQKFRSFLLFAMGGMFILYISNLAIALLLGKNYLFSDGWLPIIIACVAIVLGTLSLIATFDSVESMVRGHVDPSYQWSLAQSILIDLVWLYTELLRLLYLLNRR